MTRDDIIRMALEAGMAEPQEVMYYNFWTADQKELERFASLVAAAEREAMIEQGWRQCAKDQRTTQFCGMVEQAVLAEREACAKVVEASPSYDWHRFACEAAAAIRARGQE